MGTVYAICCTNPASGYDLGWLVAQPNTGMSGPCAMFPNSTPAYNCDESSKAVVVNNPTFNGTLRQYLDSLGGCKTESAS